MSFETAEYGPSGLLSTRQASRPKSEIMLGSMGSERTCGGVADRSPVRGHLARPGPNMSFNAALNAAARPTEPAVRRGREIEAASVDTLQDDAVLRLRWWPRSSGTALRFIVSEGPF